MQDDDYCKRAYYETRIATAMMVLIIISNLCLLGMGLFGFLYMLDKG